MGLEFTVGDGTYIYVGANPFRKSKTLAVREGSVNYTLAYFRDDESEEKFVETMLKLYGLKREDIKENRGVL